MGIVVLFAAMGLVIYALVDIWRNTGEVSSYKWGWSSIALGGQFWLPAWKLSNGWYAAVPVGALVYLLAARSGPLRRRPRSAPARSS